MDETQADGPRDDGRIQAPAARRRRTRAAGAQDTRDDWDALLQSIVEHTSAVVFLKDLEGRYLLVNGRFEDLVRLRRDAIIGRTDQELFPRAAADALRHNDLKVLAAGRALDFEETVPHPQGARTVMVTKFPVAVSGQDSSVLGGIATEITVFKQAATLLEAERRVLERIVQGAPLPAILEDIRGMVEEQAHEVVHCCCQLVAVSDLSPDLIGANVRDLTLTRGLHACCSAPICSTDGSVLGTIALYSRKRRDPTGNEMLVIDRAAMLAGIAMERQRLEENRRRAADDDSLLIEAASDGLFVCDASRRLTQADARWCKMLGYSHSELLELSLDDLLGDIGGEGRDGDQVAQLLDRRWRTEWYFRRKDGTTLLGDVSAVVLPNGSTRGIVRDITERRQRESDRLKQEAALARTDSLTGVRNRRAFEEQGNQHFSVAARHGLPVVLALMDFDKFKYVNDTLGHAEGDRVLQGVGEVLSRFVRESDVVARIGGDEFGFVLLGVNETGAHTFFTRLIQQLDQRMSAEHWPVTFSFGAAAFPSRPPTRDVAMAHADELLYSAKRSGSGSRFVIREYP